MGNSGKHEKTVVNKCLIMNRHWQPKLTLLSLIALMIVLLLFWWPTRQIPYWWDSAGLIVNGANEQLKHGFWPIFVGLPGTYGHLPFFSFILAFVWKIFGESLLVSHLVNLFWTALLFIGTFKLTKAIYPRPIYTELLAFLTGLLLLFTPLFYAQLGIIYLEIPITALAVWTVYFFLMKKQRSYLLTATLMIMIKEVSVVVIIALLLSDLADALPQILKLKKRYPFSHLIKQLFIWSLPMIIIPIWFAYHKARAGYWFSHPGTPPRRFNLSMIFQQLQLIAVFFFLQQGRFLLTIAGFISLEQVLTHDKLKRRIFQKKLLPFIFLPICAFLLYAATDFLHRYVIIALPFFYILVFYCLLVILEKQKVWVRSIVITPLMVGSLTLFIFSWDNHRQITSWHFPPLEDNLEYLDVIDIGKQAAYFLEKNYPQATVLTDFPADYMLAQPEQHYVSKPLKVVNCRQYTNQTHYDLILFHYLSPGQTICAQVIAAHSDNLQVLQVFAKNGKSLVLLGKKLEVVEIKLP